MRQALCGIQRFTSEVSGGSAYVASHCVVAGWVVLSEVSPRPSGTLCAAGGEDLVLLLFFCFSTKVQYYSVIESVFAYVRHSSLCKDHACHLLSSLDLHESSQVNRVSQPFSRRPRNEVNVKKGCRLIGKGGCNTSSQPQHRLSGQGPA